MSSSWARAQIGPKPVLQEIVRTQVCFPNVSLLVDNVVITPVGEATLTTKNETFRLFLTDGEKTIQALVRRRMHKVVLEHNVGQGSILTLTDYHLAKAKRLSGEGDIVYLAVNDFYVAGYDERYGLCSAPNLDRTVHHTHHHHGPVPQQFPNLSGPKSDGMSKERDGILLDDSATEGKHMDPKSELVAAISRCDEWIRQATVEHHQRCHARTDTMQAQKCPSVDDARFWDFANAHPLPDDEPKCISISHMALRAMTVGDPLQPIKKALKIVDLASVTGVNKSRNQTVDVLAVIASIDDSTTKPARLPLKRDIRIRDGSVSQPVTLSIFVDPVSFRSTVGIIALFRNVTTHDYRRGNLNAYPVHCDGREWFIPNPRCIDLGDVNLDDWKKEWDEQGLQMLTASESDHETKT